MVVASAVDSALEEENAVTACMRNTHITCIADTQDACGESPIWDDAKKKLHWVDIVTQRLHTFDWATRSLETRTLQIPASALALTRTANLMIAGADGVWRYADHLQPAAIAQTHHGESLAMNDCIVDQMGRLLVGSTFFDGSEHYARGSLYVVELDGTVRVLDSGFGLSNGMGFSPDGRTFYLTDSADRIIYRYDYDASAGFVANRRVFVKVPSDEGLPDGLTVDAEGFIWSAQWFGACISRYDPDGNLERRVSLPARQTSSLTFGGPDLTDIFVTTAATPDALSLAPAGYVQAGYTGGQLYHLNLGIRGKPEHRCRVLESPAS